MYALFGSPYRTYENTVSFRWRTHIIYHRLLGFLATNGFLVSASPMVCYVAV